MFFCVLDSIAFPLSATHSIHVDKLSAGFSNLGYRPIRIKNLGELRHLSCHDIVYISNHFYIYPHLKLFRNALRSSLIKEIHNSSARFILWSGNEYIDNSMLSLTNVISLEDSTFAGQTNNMINTIVINYRCAFADPTSSLIPINNRKNSVFFVGSRHYMTNKMFNDLLKVPNSFIHRSPPLLSTTAQWNLLKDSKISIGLFSKNHIIHGTYTERLPESLAAGTIFVHNHPNLPSTFAGLDSVIYFSHSNTELRNFLFNILSLPSSRLSELSDISLKFYLDNCLSYSNLACHIINAFKFK